MVPAGRLASPRVIGATGRERLEAAGIAPCAECRWLRGDVQQPCAYHAAALRRAAMDHVAKFPPGAPQTWPRAR